MKKKINLLATVLFTSSVLLVSCGGEYGENAEMPPDSQTNSQETGAEISGDKPGTGADSSHINDVLAGDTTIQKP